MSMLHFPSTLKTAAPNGVPRRSDSLNATQQKPASHQIFLTIEDELHDARRVHSHGQEEDLRSALNMVINRVGELSSLLSEAYKTQADLEVQLNVAKSNLQLVISNNEMLEEALKRDDSGRSKDVGWRRWSAREGEYREQRVSEERVQHAEAVSSNPEEVPSGTVTPNSVVAPSPPPPPPQDNRFFKFRFSNSTTNLSRSSSRSGTPSGVHSPSGSGSQNPTSPSIPSQSPPANKDLEDLTTALEKERAARKIIADEKAALEAELESLSQALFEEANKMVATERIKRAETEEELKEARLEKDALRSALTLIEGENMHLRGVSSTHDNTPMPQSRTISASHSRNSSEMGIKSIPSSPVSSRSRAPSASQDGDTEPLAAIEQSDLRASSPEGANSPQAEPGTRLSLHLVEQDMEPDSSPWADTSSSHPSQAIEPGKGDSICTAATMYSAR